MTTDTITMQPITARQFCWQECTTRDTAAAGAFYSDLFGWSREEQEHPGFNYTIFTSGDAQIAGMMAMDAQWPDGVPAHWMSYVAVKDIDTYAARVAECARQVLRRHRSNRRRLLALRRRRRRQPKRRSNLRVVGAGQQRC